jgi:hypothetical protein
LSFFFGSGQSKAYTYYAYDEHFDSDQASVADTPNYFTFFTIHMTIQDTRGRHRLTGPVHQVSTNFLLQKYTHVNIYLIQLVAHAQ